MLFEKQAVFAFSALIFAAFAGLFSLFAQTNDPIWEEIGKYHSNEAAGEAIEPETASNRLEKLEALYLAALEKKETHDEAVHFNLGLLHLRKEEFGKALHHLSRIKNDQQLLEKARFAISRIQKKTGAKLSPARETYNLFLTLITLNFLGQSQKTTLFGFANAILFAGLAAFAVFRKKWLLKVSAVVSAFCLYAGLLILWPGMGTLPYAHITADSPALYIGPGDFYNRAEIKLSDGQRVYLASKKAGWVEIEWEGRTVWIREDDQIH